VTETILNFQEHGMEQAAELSLIEELARFIVGWLPVGAGTAFALAIVATITGIFFLTAIALRLNRMLFRKVIRQNTLNIKFLKSLLDFLIILCAVLALLCVLACAEDPAVVEQPPQENLALVLYELYSVIKDRQRHPVEGSYTNYLFMHGQDKILKKVGEEAVETILASKNDSAEEILYEMGDLWYHCLVLLAFHGIKPEDLFEELMKRRKGGNYHKFTGKTGERPSD